jgi:hypothetical protein
MVLSREEAELFFKLHCALMQFVMAQVPGAGTPAPAAAYRSLPAEQKQGVVKAFLGHAVAQLRARRNVKQVVAMTDACWTRNGQPSEPTLRSGSGCCYIKATNAVHTNWVMNYSPTR